MAALAEEFDRSEALRGSNSFSRYCASCHGSSGVGDGTVADVLKVKPADLTQMQKKNGDN